MSIYEDLFKTARDEPQRLALDSQQRNVTYGQLADESRSLAGAFCLHGAEPGSGVGVMLPNIPEFATSIYASFLNGNVAVPLNVMLTPDELRHMIVDSQLRVIVCLEATLPPVVTAVSQLPDPPALIVVGKQGGGNLRYSDVIASSAQADPYPLANDSHVLTLYTSGTSGRPKGAMLSCRNLMSQSEMLAHCFSIGEGERVLCVLPMFHAFALNALLITSLRYRGTIVLHSRFQIEDCIRSLCEDRIAWFAAVPTIYNYVLNHSAAAGAVFPHLRYCLTGSAAMPVEVSRAFEERFGVPIYEGYGLSETAVCVSCNRPGHRKTGSIGKPCLNVDMRVVDETGADVERGEPGELIIRSPNVMLGYLNDPKATAQTMRHGWFYTGDVGRQDDDGFFYLVDRKKDVIIKSGYNIYPREIEEALHEHPDVIEAAVVGVRDSVKGELVKAFVVSGPHKSLCAEDLQEYLLGRLARYKHPASYVFLDALPKGGTGKVLKAKLRAGELTNIARAA